MAQRALLRSFAPRQLTRAFSSQVKAGTPFHRYLNKNPAIIGPSQVMGILDTTLTLLETGIPSKELALVRQSSDSIWSRWTTTLQAFVTTQLHVITMYGFTSDETGMKAYYEASHAASEVASPEQREEYSSVTAETWDYVLSTAFGIRDVKPLGIKRVRYLATKISAALQDPAFLDSVDQLKVSELDRIPDEGKKIKRLQEYVVPAYLSVFQVEFADGSPVALEAAYVQTMMSIHLNISDEVVSNQMVNGVSAVSRRAGLKQQGQ